MNLVTFGVGLGIFISAHSDREMLGGLAIMVMTFAIQAAEHYGDKRRERLRKATAAGVPVRGER